MGIVEIWDVTWELHQHEQAMTEKETLSLCFTLPFWGRENHHSSLQDGTWLVTAVCPGVPSLKQLSPDCRLVRFLFEIPCCHRPGCSASTAELEESRIRTTLTHRKRPSIGIGWFQGNARGLYAWEVEHLIIVWLASSTGCYRHRSGCFASLTWDSIKSQKNTS